MLIDVSIGVLLLGLFMLLQRTSLLYRFRLVGGLYLPVHLCVCSGVMQQGLLQQGPPTQSLTG